MNPGRGCVPVFFAAVRLLARGRPVRIGDLARALGWPDAEVEQVLAVTPSVARDGGAIVGWGLSLRPTPHAFHVGGRRLYVWCAMCALVLPIVLGADAHVASTCPVSSRFVRFSAGPEAVRDVDPAGAAVTLHAADDHAFAREDFCSRVRFFASAEGASTWLGAGHGSLVLPVGEAHAMARDLVHEVTSGEETEILPCCC